MSNIIRIKRRLYGTPGAPTGLKNAELAFNETDDTLYYGKGLTGSNDEAESIIAIAGPGYIEGLLEDYVTVGGYPQTITGDKEFTGEVLVPGVGVVDGTYGPVFGGVTGQAANREDLINLSNIIFEAISDIDNVVLLTTNQTINGVKTFVDSPVVPSPVGAGDAANKAYVDSVAQGLDIKESVRAATTGPITLSGAPQTIDDVVLVAGDRVLVKNQDYDPIENGIWIVVDGPWERAPDLNEYTGNASGSFTFVEDGTVNADTGWVISSTNNPTPGEDPIVWVQFSTAGTVLAGTGLEKTANTISLDGQALALHQLGVNGIFVRTGAGTVAAREITSPSASAITVTNGDGVTGNISLDLTDILNDIGGLTPAPNTLLGLNEYSAAELFTIGTLGASLLNLDDDVYGQTVARDLLGLGTMAIQDADAVAITGGIIGSTGPSLDVTIQYASIENSVIDGGNF